MEQTPEQIELAFLSSLTTAESVAAAQAAGVDSMSFQVDAHVKAWMYLARRAEGGVDVTHGDVLAVTGLQLMSDVGDTGELREMLVQSSVSRRAISAIMDIAPSLEQDARAGVVDIIGKLQELITAEQTHESNFSMDADQRLQLMLDRINKVEEEGYIGIPTGLEFFDAGGDTWKPGEMSAIVGATNAGKSWLLLWFCKNAAFHTKKNVLFLSPENTVTDIEARLDAMYANEMGFELSNRGLRNGTVDGEEYAKYIGAFKNQPMGEMIVRDSGSRGVFTIQDIIALCREHRPDILAVDGFHLVQGPGDKSWERMKVAAEQLKGLAQDLGITILTVSQAQRDAVLAPDDAPEIGQIAYGMALGEACNRILSMAEKRGSPKQRVVKLIKNRDGERANQRFYIRFDVDAGNLGQTDASVSDDGMIDFG